MHLGKHGGQAVYQVKSGGAFLVLALGALCLLGGCGQGTSGSTHDVSTTTTRPSTAPAQVSTSTLTGCPVKQVPTEAPMFHPDVTLAQSESDVAPITLQAGQRLEIRLPANVGWHLTTTDTGRALIAAKSEGWYEPSLQQCVWHFTAGGTGSARLAFSGIIVCQPTPRCPAVVELATFEVTVR